MTSVPNIYWESRCVCTLFLLRYCAYIYTFVKVLTILDFLKVLRICTVPRGSIQKANDGYRSVKEPVRLFEGYSAGAAVEYIQSGYRNH